MNRLEVCWIWVVLGDRRVSRCNVLFMEPLLLMGGVQAMERGDLTLIVILDFSFQVS